MKNIVITGGTSGIGKELVKIFSKDNNVFASYRDENKIENIENVQYFYMSLTDKNSIVEAANFIKSKTNKIDILINVAGGVVAGPVECLDCDKLREQFEINTFSHLQFSQNLLDVLENSKIINVSSMSSFGFFPFVAPYCASKRALDILFNTFAIENHKNIKVVSIKPGVIATPLWKKSVDKNSDIIDHCAGYEDEMIFMKSNALKNEENGISVEKVAKFIYKVANKKNPRASYTVGKDAKFASILSIFPQELINNVVKFGLNLRVSRSKKC